MSTLPVSVQSAAEVEVIPPFDYSILPATIAAQALEAVAFINPRLRSATATMLEVGGKLLEVKSQLEHGQFGPWIAAEFPFSIRSAENYMLAAAALEGKSETVSYLPASTVYALARAPGPVRAKVLDMIQASDAEGHRLAEESVGTMLQSEKEAAAQRRAAEREERRKAKLTEEQRTKEHKKAESAASRAKRKQADAERELRERQTSNIAREKAILAAMDMIRERFGPDLDALRQAVAACGRDFSLGGRLEAPFGSSGWGSTAKPRERPWFEEPESEWPNWVS